MTDTATATGYSVVGDITEKCILFDDFFIGGVAITLTIAICIVFKIELNSTKKGVKNNNPYYVYGIKSAVVFALLTMLCYFIKIFFMNNLLISWDFTLNIASVTWIDSLIGAIQATCIVSFYFSFTFHVQSIFYAKNDGELLPFGIKLWMIFVATVTTILMAIVVIDDATISTKKEIGITPHNIYIIMFLPHDDADIAHLMTFMLTGLDMVYFIVLMYLYTAKLRKLAIKDKKGVRGFVLLFICCVVFWIVTVSIGLNSPFKHISLGYLYLNHNICLFLMFNSGETIYNYVCGRCCNVCCSKILYGSKYAKIDFGDGDNRSDDEEPQQDASEALI